MWSAARLVGPEVSWNLRPWWALRRESLSSDLDEDTVTMWPTCPKVRPRASTRGSSGSGRSFVFLWFFNVPEPPRPSPPGLALIRRRNRAGVEVCAAAWTWASAPTRPILSRVTRAVCFPPPSGGGELGVSPTAASSQRQLHVRPGGGPGLQPRRRREDAYDESESPSRRRVRGLHGDPGLLATGENERPSAQGCEPLT